MTRTTIECSPSGVFFDFTDPRPEMIHVEDIARSLSQQCRFGGFTSRFYSVAEHALLVHRLVADVAGPELAFAALHHDSHEAYLGDVPTPLKALLGREFKDLADNIDWVLGERFGLDEGLFDHDIIKAADVQALYIEASVLKVSRGTGPDWENYTPLTAPRLAVQCCDPKEAEFRFLDTHRRASDALLASRLAA